MMPRRKKYVRPLLESYAQVTIRVVNVTFRKTNGHISVASNSAIKLATGQYLATHDPRRRTSAPCVCLEVAKVIKQKSGVRN